MSIWIRKWGKVDLNKVSDSLLVIGVLHAECFSCHSVGISKDSKKCPDCGAEFKYVGFRGKVSIRELDKVVFNTNLEVIDFSDFQKEYKRRKAKGLFK